MPNTEPRTSCIQIRQIAFGPPSPSNGISHNSRKRNSGSNLTHVLRSNPKWTPETTLVRKESTIIHIQLPNGCIELIPYLSVQLRRVQPFHLNLIARQRENRTGSQGFNVKQFVWRTAGPTKPIPKENFSFSIPFRQDALIDMLISCGTSAHQHPCTL